MNRRSLLALPLALVAAPAAASTGVFAWVDRLLAKRNVRLVPSKAPGLTCDFSNTYTSLGPVTAPTHATSVASLEAAFADHRASSTMTITTTRSDGLVSTMTLDTSGRLSLTRSRKS
jgi:hypothetical protein